MRILLTGGCGFVGSNFVRHVLAHSDHEVLNLDKLTYSGCRESLADVDADPALARRHRFVRGCITDAAVVEPLVRAADAVVHMAAESHVDRSIADGRVFVETNVLGTQTLLEAFRRDPQREAKRFLHVSTDEVYGDLPLNEPQRKFREDTPYAPSSPYAASKAASDLLVRAYARTFGLDAVITNCSNNFGPCQFPEKLIPRFITRLMAGEKVPLYGDGRHVRDWLHVEDHCEAVLAVLERGRAGETYNVGGNNERSNLELTRALLGQFGLGEERIEPVEDRAGHDRRYAVDASKIRAELGWSPSRSAWPEALEETVAWYRANEAWWRPLLERSRDAAKP